MLERRAVVTCRLSKESHPACLTPLSRLHSRICFSSLSGEAKVFWRRLRDSMTKHSRELCGTKKELTGEKTVEIFKEQKV